MAVERVAPGSPEAEGWRPEATAASRHTRLLDQLVEPAGLVERSGQDVTHGEIDDSDVERAREVCGEVCRNVLGDFAPALALLPTNERLRAQAVAAYTITLFDFALQTGVEGERLAAINRWEFTLDSVLGGDQTIAQPVFVLLLAAGEPDSWPLAGFDTIAEAARQRVAKPRPYSRDELCQRALLLAEGLAHVLIGQPSPLAAEMAALIVRLGWLLRLDDGLRRRRPQLPSTELPLDEVVSYPEQQQIVAVAAAENRAIEQQLRRLLPRTKELPRRQRRAASYLVRAGLYLCRAIGTSPQQLLETPPQIGAGARLRLLAQARLFG